MGLQGVGHDLATEQQQHLSTLCPSASALTNALPLSLCVSGPFLPPCLQALAKEILFFFFGHASRLVRS